MNYVLTMFSYFINIYKQTQACSENKGHNQHNIRIFTIFPDCLCLVCFRFWGGSGGVLDDLGRFGDISCGFENLFASFFLKFQNIIPQGNQFPEVIQSTKLFSINIVSKNLLYAGCNDSERIQNLSMQMFKLGCIASII